ncbi:MAG: HRDC domain-containing protein [Anaerolineales bacterium]|nr:HRDC domain-containing protein [Anaerolineales bacterium]
MSDILPPPVWIDRPEELERFLPLWLSQPRLAVDTESNSLYAYRERVCLIQLSTFETDYLLDPFALSNLSSLASLFAHPEIEKVFHAVEYDLIGLRRDFGFEIVNLFDTMQSARILGYEKVGLEALLKLKYGVNLNKRYQKANWGMRPLTAAMLNYARLDTRYLLRLRDDLKSELEQRGLWMLAQEEFIRLARGNGVREESLAGRRLARIQSLTPVQRGVLHALWEWRERTAERLDWPVFRVLPDRELLRLARRVPSTLDALQMALHAPLFDRYGKELLAAIQKGIEHPIPSPHRLPSASAEVIRRSYALSEWRRQCARRLGLESDIVLPKAWLQAIAERAPTTLEELAPLLPDSPWRLEKFGQEILSVLQKNL